MANHAMKLGFKKWRLKKRQKVVDPHITELAWGGSSLLEKVEYSNGEVEVHKQLLPRFRGSMDGEALILNEFRILNEVQHPLIVQARRLEKRDLGEMRRSNVLVLDFVEGSGLCDLKTYFDTLSVEEKIEWLRGILLQLGSVLRYIHSKYVIHGDISPDNIIVGHSGFISIIDFGNSKQTGFPSPAFGVAGKKYFRAPELLLNGQTSVEGDLFAVGRILEWLSGESVSAEVQQLIDALCVDRKWPDIQTAYLEALKLPKRPAKGGKAVSAVTDLIPIVPWWSLTRPLSQLAAITVLFMFLSSGLPQRAELAVNSIPFSFVTVDQVPGQTFETPMDRIQVPSGALTVRFFFSTKGNKSIVRRVKAKPLERLKVFEDFRDN